MEGEAGVDVVVVSVAAEVEEEEALDSEAEVVVDFAVEVVVAEAGEASEADSYGYFARLVIFI